MRMVMLSTTPSGSWISRSSGTQRVIGSSRERRPRSRSWSTAIAVSVLVTEAQW